MAVSPAVFATGVATAAGATVYTVPANRVAIITFGSFYNTTGGTVNIALTLNDGLAAQVFSVDLTAGQTFVWTDRPVLLTGTQIVVKAGSDAAVNYYISGGTIVV